MVAECHRDCVDLASTLRRVIGLADATDQESRFCFLSTQQDDPQVVPGALTPALIVTGVVTGESVSLVCLEDDVFGFPVSSGGVDARQRRLKLRFKVASVERHA
jgi:hypothetical protein